MFCFIYPILTFICSQHRIVWKGAKVVVNTLWPPDDNPVATPIRFCSAIPTSRYLSGYYNLKRSKPAEVDTSDVSTIRLSISFAKSKHTIPKVALEPIVENNFIFDLSSFILIQFPLAYQAYTLPQAS